MTHSNATEMKLLLWIMAYSWEKTGWYKMYCTVHSWSGKSGISYLDISYISYNFESCQKLLIRLVFCQESDIPVPGSREGDLFPRGALDQSKTCKRSQVRRRQRLRSSVRQWGKDQIMLCTDSPGVRQALRQAEEERRAQMGKVGGLQTGEWSWRYGGEVRKLPRGKVKRTEMNFWRSKELGSVHFLVMTILTKDISLPLLDLTTLSLTCVQKVLLTFEKANFRRSQARPIF